MSAICLIAVTFGAANDDSTSEKEVSDGIGGSGGVLEESAAKTIQSTTNKKTDEVQTLSKNMSDTVAVSWHDFFLFNG